MKVGPLMQVAYRIKPIHVIIVWATINLIQAAFTELTSDEGYYWFFSTKPEWGYYDHPPMTAWLIRAGYSLFENEFGVRLLNVLVNTGSLVLFYHLLPKSQTHPSLNLLLLFSIPLLNYISFLVFPDGPLLFFSLILLLAYKQFLQKPGVLSTIIAGFAMAGMIYSKYTGVLIIAFILLSNPKLLLSYQIYLAMLVATILLWPHFAWLLENKFSGLSYHLSGRVSGFTTKHLLEYLSQQIVALGALSVAVFFLPQPMSLFEKSLKFIAIGTLAFFLVVSFYAFVHFHWTSLAIFPILILLSNAKLSNRQKRWLKWICLPFLVLLVLIRVQLIIPVFPIKKINVDYYHGRKSWAQEIDVMANKRPVVFVEDFREASLYTFYSGEMGVALFNGRKRKSQFDTWLFEDSIQGKEVVLLQTYPAQGAREYKTVIGRKYYLTEIRNYLSFYNLSVDFFKTERVADSVRLSISISNHRNRALDFKADAGGNYPVLYYGIFERGKFFFKDTLRVFNEMDFIGAQTERVFNVVIADYPGKAQGEKFVVGFEYGILPASFNGIMSLPPK